MNRAWDATGIAFRPETWQRIMSHLHPGGFLMAFASARGWHRMACAIEDAGFIIHPTIYAWVTGSGFPKSTRIDASASMRFCECGSSQPQSKLHGTECSGHDGSQTVRDSQGGCPESSRCDDAQPRSVQGNDQVIEQQLGDARKRSHSAEPSARSQTDIAPSHIPSAAQCNDRRASKGSPHHDKTQPASLKLQEREGATDRGGRSTDANERDSKMESCQPSDILAGDTSVSDIHGSCSSGDRLRLSSYEGNHTRKTSHCQACGLPRREVWRGHRYGLQALKPAAEIIIVAQKPYEGKPALCITKTGAGALNVDGGRIGTTDKLQSLVGSFSFSGSGGANETGKKIIMRDAGAGRWPANFVLCCLPTCTGEAHDPDCPAARLDRQSGELTSGKPCGTRKANHHWNSTEQGTELTGFGDTGGASRYFFRAVADAIDDADPVRYVAKASRRERDAGCDNLEAKTVSTSNALYQKCKKCGRNRISPIRAIQSCQCIEPDFEYVKLKNHHPTVKPIALAKYLATLLLPPAEYAPRRILIPFSGSGSEMIGAMQAGWEEVVGIEKDADYIKISEARIKHELAQVKQPQEQELVMA